MDISGKVGFVTGGADGIGKVLVENLLKKGAKGVTFVDFNEELGLNTCKEFQELYGEDRVLFCKANVIHKDNLEDAFKKTVDKFGALHIMCNNAGIADEVNWERMFQVNLNGTIYGTLLAIEHMNDTEVGGVVVNISSAAAMVGAKVAPLYSVAKQAVNGFSRNIALYDLTAKEKNVRVNIVCPLKVDKPLPENRRFTNEDSQSKLQGILDPAKRAAFAMVICSMQDVANAMLMFIEEGVHNGKTALVFSDNYPIVDDPQQQFRKEVLNVEDDHFDKILAAITSQRNATS